MSKSAPAAVTIGLVLHHGGSCFRRVVGTLLFPSAGLRHASLVGRTQYGCLQRGEMRLMHQVPDEGHHQHHTTNTALLAVLKVPEHRACGGSQVMVGGVGPSRRWLSHVRRAAAYALRVPACAYLYEHAMHDTHEHARSQTEEGEPSAVPACRIGAPSCRRRSLPAPVTIPAEQGTRPLPISSTSSWISLSLGRSLCPSRCSVPSSLSSSPPSLPLDTSHLVPSPAPFVPAPPLPSRPPFSNLCLPPTEGTNNMAVPASCPSDGGSHAAAGLSPGGRHWAGRGSCRGQRAGCLNQRRAISSCKQARPSRFFSPPHARTRRIAGDLQRSGRW